MILRLQKTKLKRNLIQFNNHCQTEIRVAVGSTAQPRHLVARLNENIEFRGRCLIAVGGRITRFQKRGVGLHIKRFYAFSPTMAPEFKDVVKFTCCSKGKTKRTLDGFFAGGSAHNMLSMASRAPLPNAAKVFVNWLLSREGQMAWMKDDETQCSRRTDLQSSWCVDYLNKKDPTQFIPLKEDGTYISLHTTSNVQHRYTSHRIGM